MQNSSLQDQCTEFILVKRDDEVSGDLVLSISRVIPVELKLARELFDAMKGFVKESEIKALNQVEMLAHSVKKDFTKIVLKITSELNTNSNLADVYINLLISAFSQINKPVGKLSKEDIS